MQQPKVTFRSERTILNMLTGFFAWGWPIILILILILMFPKK